MKRDVHRFPNELLRAATALGLGSEQFKMANPGRWRKVLRDILLKFTGSTDVNRQWIWAELLGETVAMRSKNGPDELRNMLDCEAEIWLIVEDWYNEKEEGCHWVFEGTVYGVSSVLNECHHFEYAIVDKKLAWIICENHHSMLVAAGEPIVSWLRDSVLKQRIAH